MPRFTDISRQAGVDKFGAGRGSVLGDFDGDGLSDIIAAGMWGPLSFFHNEGSGKFSDWTERSGLSGIRNTFIVVAADYDNDGRLDLYATRLFMWGARKNVLLHNEGGGRFRDVTEEAGVECPGASMSAAWGDYDLDGLVDLYVTNTSDAAPLPFGLNPLSYLGRTANALYRNNGDGTFTDMSRKAGVDLTGLYLGAVWGDYNADGFPDLYISQFFGPNLLFKNRGDGTFVDVAKELGVEAPFCSFTSWFWDFDADGHLDILSTGWAPLTDSIKNLVYGTRETTTSMQLYRNRGDGTFENQTVAAGLDQAHGTMGANFGDLDNDGYPDFALGTGSPQVEYVQPNALYHNNRNGTFTNVASSLGMGHLQKGHGYAFGDLDDDGRTDIYLPLGGGYPGDAWSNVLYHNEGPVGHWLAVKLEGGKRDRSSRGSNRAAIGARIYVTAEGRRRTVEVTGGSGFGSSSLQQHLGLGEATRVDRLEIYWPASRARQVFTDLEADRVIQINEFGSDYRVVSRIVGK
ncbi:MAG: CRTAC1 family protein [Acidobacteria bacterium]|nr:CRTAC1 family protein [Acidobacteriota bacterium]